MLKGAFMDLDHLVEQITDMVMSRLSAEMQEEYAPERQVPVKSASADAISSERLLNGIIVLTERRPQLEDFYEQIRTFAGMPISWTVILSPAFPSPEPEHELHPLKIQVIETLPEAWRGMIVSADFIVVPILTMTLCSKIAHLIADDQPSQVVLAALMESKPIIVGAEEITFLNRFSAQLPKPLVSVQNSTMEIVRSMGLREVPLKSLESEIKRLMARVSSFGRGANVITKTDIEAAVREGKTKLEFMRGTIVTPLAREYAEMMHIAIVSR
jgi:hypothetical protein